MADFAAALGHFALWIVAFCWIFAALPPAGWIADRQRRRGHSLWLDLAGAAGIIAWLLLGDLLLDWADGALNRLVS